MTARDDNSARGVEEPEEDEVTPILSHTQPISSSSGPRHGSSVPGGPGSKGHGVLCEKSGEKRRRGNGGGPWRVPHTHEEGGSVYS